ncbi:MAG: hypothetical protein U0N62_01065, partial [Hydrogeniiclostridium sp.]
MTQNFRGCGFCLRAAGRAAEHAVAQHVGAHCFHIVGQDIGASLKRGVGLSRMQQSKRSAGACSVAETFVGARGLRDGDNVSAYRFSRIDPAADV